MHSLPSTWSLIRVILVGKKASVLDRLSCSIAEFYPVLFILSDSLRSPQKG